MLILTPREKLLLRRMAQHKTDREIAVQIGGTPLQVCGQRKRLIEKLQIQSEADLASWASQHARWPKP
ncbi:hypothetical protein CI1B_84090 [Bradyrhizobium ivorense]|uniref:HTH luxR-type domain-containing protein n=1 Tax=Bradyrhizobium ivorense TaxID=2511166 RepID=A0A508U2C7_9BRAD|nr:LuxR C-terminal-related transcriptional regulator [Bradyrhizobium ivorense]VIO80382.1 hypothetical protein CI1B_84090 [Bradyrhizobium ivorense]